jgi:hypothetical protein
LILVLSLQSDYHGSEVSLPKVATPWTIIRLLSKISAGLSAQVSKILLFSEIVCAVQVAASGLPSGSSQREEKK